MLMMSFLLFLLAKNNIRIISKSTAVPEYRIIEVTIFWIIKHLIQIYFWIYSNINLCRCQLKIHQLIIACQYLYCETSFRNIYSLKVCPLPMVFSIFKRRFIMVHFYKFINELYILFNQLLTIFINNHFINLYFLILIYFSCIFYMNLILIHFK